MFTAIINYLLFNTGFPVTLCFTLLIVAGFLTNWLIEHPEEEEDE